MMKKTTQHAAMLLGISVMTTSAIAHHSVARFDREHQIAVEGTVKEFRWGNPHTWLVVLVPNDKGGVDEWEMEGGTVNGMIRQGYTKNTIQPGQKIRVVVSPMKDGTLGGEWMRVLTLNGAPPNLTTQK